MRRYSSMLCGPNPRRVFCTKADAVVRATTLRLVPTAFDIITDAGTGHDPVRRRFAFLMEQSRQPERLVEMWRGSAVQFG